MVPIVKKYPWSCLTAATAMALDVEEDDIFRAVGHTGGHVQWPENAPKVSMYRGFCQQEIVDALLVEYDVPVVTLAVAPTFTNGNEEGCIPLYEDAQGVLEDWLEFSSGVLLGRYDNGFNHALANIAGQMYDPDTGALAEPGFDAEWYLMFYGV